MYCFVTEINCVNTFLSSVSIRLDGHKQTKLFVQFWPVTTCLLELLRFLLKHSVICVGPYLYLAFSPLEKRSLATLLAMPVC